MLCCSQQRSWLARQVEERASLQPDEQANILHSLVNTDALEAFLAKHFPRSKVTSCSVRLPCRFFASSQTTLDEGVCGRTCLFSNPLSRHSDSTTDVCARLHLLQEAARQHACTLVKAQQGQAPARPAQLSCLQRFGVEGSEALLPGLQEVVQRCAQHGIKRIEVGMPHRGRLNVLCNLLHKPPAALFQVTTAHWLPKQVRTLA